MSVKKLAIATLAVCLAYSFLHVRSSKSKMNLAQEETLPPKNLSTKVSSSPKPLEQTSQQSAVLNPIGTSEVTPSSPEKSEAVGGKERDVASSNEPAPESSEIESEKFSEHFRATHLTDEQAQKRGIKLSTAAAKELFQKNGRVTLIETNQDLPMVPISDLGVQSCQMLESLEPPVLFVVSSGGMIEDAVAQKPISKDLLKTCRFEGGPNRTYKTVYEGYLHP